MAEARAHASGTRAAREGAAAAELLEAGRAAVATGAARVAVRRLEQRVAAAGGHTVDQAAVAEALWHARCVLAATPRDVVAAFPGVRRCTAAEAVEARRHPLRPGVDGGLLGSIYERGGRQWCVEELAVASDEGGLGLYAYGVAQWAGATQHLDEQCEFFDEGVLRELELERAVCRKRARDLLDSIGAPSGKLQGTGSGEPAMAAPRLGRVEVGMAASTDAAEGWHRVYVGRTPYWRTLYGDEGDSLGNPWALANNGGVEARAKVCTLCDALSEDLMGAPVVRSSQRGTRGVLGTRRRGRRALRPSSG